MLAPFARSTPQTRMWPFPAAMSSGVCLADGRVQHSQLRRTNRGSSHETLRMRSKYPHLHQDQMTATVINLSKVKLSFSLIEISIQSILMKL
jgi:hypothetical protein